MAKAPLQPRRLIIAPAAVGCKRLLGGDVSLLFGVFIQGFSDVSYGVFEVAGLSVIRASTRPRPDSVKIVKLIGNVVPTSVDRRSRFFGHHGIVVLSGPINRAIDVSTDRHLSVARLIDLRGKHLRHDRYSDPDINGTDQGDFFSWRVEAKAADAILDPAMLR